MTKVRKPPKLRPALGDLIRKNLARYREAAGLTHDEVAERAGISAVAVRMIACGQNNPSLSTLDVLAKALGVLTAELLVPENTRIVLAPSNKLKSPRK